MVVALGFDKTTYFMALLALVVALATKACVGSDVVSVSPPGTPRLLANFMRLNTNLMQLPVPGLS